MTIWVALVRGVNVGGGNKLPMAGFRASVTSLGYSDVATYIQSGNVVFGSDEDEATIVDRLRSVLADRHGLSVPVVVRSADEVAGVTARHPFADQIGDPKLLHVAFLDRAPDASAVDAIDADGWLPDRWALDGRELFLSYPNGSGRSKMTIDRFERPWEVTATARNLNTVAKLVDMTSPHRAS
jgi:uncharacterized protein (DUF1697 family)